MNYKQVINEEFDSFVRKTFPKLEIQSYLLSHERRPLLVNNLVRELSKSEYVILNGNADLEDKRKTVRGLAKDFAKAFCKQAIMSKEKEMKSRIIV